MCRLFSTQKQLFDFCDAESERQCDVSHKQWHLFSIEFPSEDEVAQRLSHATQMRITTTATTTKPANANSNDKNGACEFADVDNVDSNFYNDQEAALLHWQLFTERHKFRPHATLLVSPSKQSKTEADSTHTNCNVELFDEMSNINNNNNNNNSINIFNNICTNDKSNSGNDVANTQHVLSPERMENTNITSTTLTTTTLTTAGNSAQLSETSTFMPKREWGARRRDFIVWYGEHSLSTQTRFFLAATRRGIVELHARIPPLQRHLYEIIREGLPCHIYLDVERTDNYNFFKDYVNVDENEDANSWDSSKSELLIDLSDDEVEVIEPLEHSSNDISLNQKEKHANVFNKSELKQQEWKKECTVQEQKDKEVQWVSAKILPQTINIAAHLAHGSTNVGMANVSSQYSYNDSVENYTRSVNALQFSKTLPLHCCPLTCNVKPANTQTERVLLRELALFIRASFPELVPSFTETTHKENMESGVHANANANNLSPCNIDNTFAEVMVMRSLPWCRKDNNKTNSSTSLSQPIKFSQHYTVKMANNIIADNNFTVGEFVRRFVEHLHHRVDDGDEEVHAALFYHAEPLMYNTRQSAEVRQHFNTKMLQDNSKIINKGGGESSTTNYSRNSSINYSRNSSINNNNNNNNNTSNTTKQLYLPFLQRKCVIDNAVYSRNRTMRCLGSCKLNKDSVLEVQTFNKQSESLTREKELEVAKCPEHTGERNVKYKNQYKEPIEQEEQSKKDKMASSLESEETFLQSFFASLICAYHNEEIETFIKTNNHTNNTNIESKTECAYHFFHLNPINDRHYKFSPRQQYRNSLSPLRKSQSKSRSTTPPPTNHSTSKATRAAEQLNKNKNHETENSSGNDQLSYEPTQTSLTPQLTLSEGLLREEKQWEQQEQYEESQEQKQTKEYKSQEEYLEKKEEEEWEEEEERYQELENDEQVVNELQAAYSIICNRPCIVHKPLIISNRFISYQVTGTHYCQNIQREHKSNNIYLVLDKMHGTWVQKCFDPDCASFRSAPQKLNSLHCNKH